jgi:DEAD/DEAH box helicase domain-containing protein
MGAETWIEALRGSPFYAGQITHIHRVPARAPVYAAEEGLPAPLCAALHTSGEYPLYSHQLELMQLAQSRRDGVLATGVDTGKSSSLRLAASSAMLGRDCCALILCPSRSSCLDHAVQLEALLAGAGLGDVTMGAMRGEMAAATRRRLREEGRLIITTPDMVHAGLMPQHARWQRFLSRLDLLIIDDLHAYGGMFGAGMGNLVRRLLRVAGHYGARPTVQSACGPVANAAELMEALTGRAAHVIDQSGAPSGLRTFVLWNPPIIRSTRRKARRGALIEAADIMARLITAGAPTIAFSKAKISAELIARYCSEELGDAASAGSRSVEAYRAGYLQPERRAIEQRLLAGSLAGVSATPALENGIRTGSLAASVLVGYPGTLTAFLQQAGRAGRADGEGLCVLVGLETPANQYIMRHPEYLFGRPLETASVDPHNPFVVMGHLRCAAHEMPMEQGEMSLFGPHASTAMAVLEAQGKVRRIGHSWYHATSETPQHEFGLRSMDGADVPIQDRDTGQVIGHLNEYDAQPLIHEGAVYMQHGDTYLVDHLDLGRKVCTVHREDVDYYTQPSGGTDVNHIDHVLRRKPMGSGECNWGEVTAHFDTTHYSRIPFRSLDAASTHAVFTPTMWLETMAVWFVAPEPLLSDVRRAGLDVMQGLRGIGYAARMLLPLFVRCDTADLSHSVGCSNSPWQAVFIYERLPRGLGYSQAAYDRIHEVLPAVYDAIRKCECRTGCPLCVGKPLRRFTTWNVERGEGSVPDKRASMAILKGLLADHVATPEIDNERMTENAEAVRLSLERELKRRLERQREPKLPHAIEFGDRLERPEPPSPAALTSPDASTRSRTRAGFDRELVRRLRRSGAAEPHAELPGQRLEMPAERVETSPQTPERSAIRAGDDLASLALLRARRKPEPPAHETKETTP